MIIISAGAGLGNQMFEYAFYLRMKELYPKTRIKMDSKYAFPTAHNGYEIEKIFNIKSKKASLLDVICLSSRCPVGIPFYDKFVELYKRRYYKYGNKKTFIKQDQFHLFYDKFFNFDISKNYYCYGPFCNYKYFEGLKTNITEVFSFPELDDVNKSWASKMQGTNSVSIHLRRGDYVKENIKSTNTQYYLEAIKELETMMDDCVFFVFSDDKEYVKSIFENKDNIFIVDCNNGTNSYRDMQLMSMCKHNIIANSTFSFWGAYLNQNDEKIVYAPNISFVGNDEYSWPDSWRVLEVK